MKMGLKIVPVICTNFFAMKITPVLRPKSNKKGEKPVFIRITHQGKTRYISTGVFIKEKYWNKRIGKVRVTDYFDADTLNKIISDKLKEATDQAWELRATREIVNSGMVKEALTQDQQPNEPERFFSYADRFQERKARENVRTGRRYGSILKKLRGYAGERLTFEEITPEFINRYADYLAEDKGDKKGNGWNTIHSNLRGVKAIINAAISEGIMDHGKNPFLRLRLKQPKVRKEKLTLDEFKKLAAFQAFPGSWMDRARDLFVFSALAAGMRFSDLCLLQWENVSWDTLTYRMSKNDKAVSLPLTDSMKDILGKYKRDSGYVFPMLWDLEALLADPTIPDEKKQSKKINRISTFNALVNKELKELCRKVGISKRISMHSARHTFADLARKGGVDIYAISKSLRHSSLKITEGYLASLDDEATNKEIRTFIEGLEIKGVFREDE